MKKKTSTEIILYTVESSTRYKGEIMGEDEEKEVGEEVDSGGRGKIRYHNNI